MASKVRKRQSRLGEYGPVTTKHSKLDSSVNESDSTEDISSNINDDIQNVATDAESSCAVSSNKDDDTRAISFDSRDINNILGSKLSIFKLANNRLEKKQDGIKIKGDIKEFGKCIKEKLIDKGMKYKGENCDKCKPYHLMHFFYSTKDKDNVTAVEIAEQLAYPEGIGDFPGDRRSGNILVFYRLKQNVPEAFFLCQGFAYHCILYISDPSFRTRVVKRFMDGKKIKEIETLNIAGSVVTSTITYKDNCNIAAVSFLERAIVSLSGIIVRNSKLDKLIQRDGSKEILMKVGINFVRICKPLPWEEWTNVLELFSDEVDDKETEVDGPTSHIVDAFEYVRRVEEDTESRALDDIITKKFINIITKNKPTSSYYLSHRYIRDWSLSSNVILSENHTTPKFCDEITSWNSAPTLIMVIEAINRHFKTYSCIEKCLREHNIVLSYGRKTGMKNIPVQDFVHGSVSKLGRGQYFKIAQKWFFLSSTYSQVVDRNFAYMFQCMLVDKRISNLMIYPWRTRKLEITISDRKKFLGDLPNAGQEILQKLTQECKLVDKLGDEENEENHCCLTKHSYLLPQSSELYKELTKKKKGNVTEEKKGKNTKGKKGKSTTEKGKNTKTRSNTPRPKSSVDSSAPVGSITDTPSSSLNTPLPSTSNLTLGSGLNTPEVDNDNTSHQDSGIGLASSVDSSAPVGSITDTPSSSLNTPFPSTSNLTLGIGLNTSEVDNDIDQNQTSTSDDENSEKKSAVGKMLYQVLTSDGVINDSGVLSVLREKKREICVQKGGKYFVCNPILTDCMMKQIKSIKSSLEEPILSNFLRCMSPLSEGDYNALYLNCDKDDNFIIFPGDRVLANNVELFDILVYDKENHTTYLFHNKEGLDHHTRDACAQIRNSSELLWHDFMRGQRNHIELFWESAVKPKKAETPYRYFLQRKLTELGKDTFMKMFDDDAKIVFVLGFVFSQSKASSKLQWKFKQLTLQDFQENDLKEEDNKWLETEGILTKSMYLNDCFIGMTQDKFVDKFKSPDMKSTKLKKIFTLLRTKATCNLSTIAKLELLTLNNCFSRYQTGGERHYHLKLLQLDSN